MMEFKNNETITYKKILCNNIITNKKCCYKNKCLYAHSLEEQKLEPIRKKAYNLIKNNIYISNAELKKNKELYNVFIIFTNLCIKCSKQMCPGGYNCKYGVVDNKYKICSSNLYTGTCLNTKCKCIHIVKSDIDNLEINLMTNINFSNYDENTSDSDHQNDSLSNYTSSESNDNKINSIFKYT